MSNNIDIKEVENDISVTNIETEEPTYKVANISEDDLHEIIAASKKEEDIEKPIVMSKLNHNLLYSGVFMLDKKPGFVIVKESELAMVLEEIKKAKNLQIAQQKLVTEQNRVYLKAELDKTQKALQEALEENASLLKQNEGLQRRVDELEYRNVDVKMQDIKRIDETMQKVSLESIAESQKKRPQPKATIMLIQESNDNVERERFKSIVEADKTKREESENDGFGDEEINTVERVSVEIPNDKKADIMKEESDRIDKEVASLVSDIVTPKNNKDNMTKTNAATLANIEKAQIRKSQVLALSIKGVKSSEIMKILKLSKNTVYNLLSVSKKELKELYNTYPQIFKGISVEDIEKRECKG